MLYTVQSVQCTLDLMLWWTFEDKRAHFSFAEIKVLLGSEMCRVVRKYDTLVLVVVHSCFLQFSLSVGMSAIHFCTVCGTYFFFVVIIWYIYHPGSHFIVRYCEDIAKNWVLHGEIFLSSPPPKGAGLCTAGKAKQVNLNIHPNLIFKANQGSGAQENLDIHCRCFSLWYWGLR